jgi:hypothetical protein
VAGEVNWLVAAWGQMEAERRAQGWFLELRAVR